MEMTFGAEYEFGDIWRTDLPEGLTWNSKDYSIVSSTGIANDPKGLLYSRGGEINSKPTDNIYEQLDMFSQLMVLHPEARVNHRTNLHIHVGVPALLEPENLWLLKQVFLYAQDYQDRIYEELEPIPKPPKEDYLEKGAWKGAMKRYNRRKVSHQYRVRPERVEEILAAKDHKEFFDGHSKLQKNGKRAYGLTTRAGINFLQLQETGTIEFRHFTNSTFDYQIADCFSWCKHFMESALENLPLIIVQSDWDFPYFLPYNHYMETGYAYTNFHHNPRKVVKERLEDLVKSGLKIGEDDSAPKLALFLREERGFSL
jgi:hypothetical protein